MNTLPVQHEQESRTTYPTRGVESRKLNREDESLAPNTFAVHEGLLVMKNERGDMKLAADTDSVRQELLDQGMTLGESAVPFTGAESNNRFDEDGRPTREWLRAEQDVVLGLAAREKGLRSVDSDSLSDTQRAELGAIGFSGSDMYGIGLLVGRGNKFTVSSGDVLSGEELYARAEHIGTFAHAQVEGKDMIALTDQMGNEVLAPASETLAGLLSNLGYQENSEPTFSTDFTNEDLRMNDRHNELYDALTRA